MGSIGLRGLQLRIPVGVPLVDQVLLVDPVPVARDGDGQPVTYGAQQQGECGEPLLAVDYQPVLHSAGTDGRARREHKRPHEMRQVGPFLAILGKLEDILPELVQLVLSP